MQTFVVVYFSFAEGPKLIVRSTEDRTMTAPTGASVVVEPEDGQWVMPAKNYASARFSGLDEINTSNVANLKLAWSFSTGSLRGYDAPSSTPRLTT